MPPKADDARGSSEQGKNPWDERYATTGLAYGAAPNDFLRDRIGELRHGPTLCLAEGEGRNALFLSARGFDVLAVDSSEVGLAKAGELALDRGLNLAAALCDLSDFVIEPGHWSTIISIWCHLPGPLRRKVHEGCVRGLRRGGTFLLEAYRPEQLAYDTGGPREPERLASLAELQEELRGLDFLVARELLREVHEGRLHNGQSAVVQLIAVKR